MKQRIITALVLAPLAIAAIFFLPLKFFILFATIVFLLASKEWAGFVSKEPSSKILYLFAIVLGLSLFLMPSEHIWIEQTLNPYISSSLIVAAVWWCVALLMVIRYPVSATLWKSSRAIKALFGLLTLVPFFWGLVVLRSVNMNVDFYFGSQLVMYVFLLVWAADSGAYFAGRQFGKRKLAPNVSPGKTVEGLLGGLVCAVIVTYLASQYFSIADNKLTTFFIASIITTLVSALGDLTESIFKREAGLKDSSNLLPGHGGILDRIDSLTAAVPVFALIYIYWLA
ncbi:phosphatidate cytidylyltransferase [Psychromonas sp. 14N.309.X.WAT.B.A12]|uniref:phosphatidate cytidylyltransferase n=1 Tax=unclassified Psychromonas TaxID=2614957 RepID=UPI0025B13B7D|nr:phosphatidate cytidylyltransferase [Psychromonas sp. 14N.309.X.WAT.B.A12]MDN2662897.1 phosphatidate cytidylyltransferase [Psychromonas sp. 14N.309.X.WAT.B.A12]